MLVQRPVHIELEMTKWIVVLVIATAFVLGLIVSSTAAADTGSNSEPRLLPPDVQATAKPMLATDATSSSVVQSPTAVKSHGDNIALWGAIRRLESSVPTKNHADHWRRVPMSKDAETWRQVVVGLLHMDDGEYAKAAKALMAAEKARPDNPIAHYGLALLRLKQADTAWDRIPPKSVFRLAVLQTPKVDDVDTSVSPNTAAMYEYVAMMELRRALRFADELDLNQRLLDTKWTTPPAEEIGSSMPLETARVGDLLEALDVTDFERRAHTLLGRLYLKQGMPERAWEHLRQGEPSSRTRTAVADSTTTIRLLGN